MDISLQAILESADAYLAIATAGEETIAYLLGFDRFTFFANGRVSWVEEIIVKEEVRRQGVGLMLLRSYEE